MSDDNPYRGTAYPETKASSFIGTVMWLAADIGTALAVFVALSVVLGTPAIFLAPRLARYMAELTSETSPIIGEAIAIFWWLPIAFGSSCAGDEYEIWPRIQSQANVGGR